MIRTFLASVMTMCALGVELRGTQQLDILQPLELSVQLFGQSFDTTVQALERQLIAALYPDNAADVQSQIDTCEANFWNAEVANLQGLNRDILSLANACTAEDPTAPVMQVMNDAIGLIATVVADCDALSVDLQTDIMNFLAGLIVQGFQLTRPFVGPADQLLNGSLPPFDIWPPLRSTIASWFVSIGSSQESYDSTEVNASAFIADLNRIQAEIASSSVPQADDVAASMRDLWALANTDGTVFAEIFRNSVQYVTPFVQTMCSFAGPLLALTTPSS